MGPTWPTTVFVVKESFLNSRSLMSANRCVGLALWARNARDAGRVSHANTVWIFMSDRSFAIAFKASSGTPRPLQSVARLTL